MRARTGTATAHGSEDRHEKVIAFAETAPPTTVRRLRDPERDDGRSRPSRPRTATPSSSSRRAPSTPRAAARSPIRAAALGRGRGRGPRRLPGRRRPGAGGGGRRR